MKAPQYRVCEAVGPSEGLVPPDGSDGGRSRRSAFAVGPGFAESAIAVSQAVHTIRPDMKIQPAYSTNTGVPSAESVAEGLV